MNSKWIITLPGFEGFRFGEDGFLYKLPYKDIKGRQRQIYRVHLCGMTKTWNLKINGKRGKFSRTRIKKYLAVDSSPVKLF